MRRGGPRITLIDDEQVKRMAKSDRERYGRDETARNPNWIRTLN